MKVKCTLTLSRENPKSYRSKLVKFELEIKKKTPEDIKNDPISNQYLLFLPNGCSNYANIARSGLFKFN